MRELTRWRAAVARAQAGQGCARLLMLGDSTTFGYGSQGGEGYLRTPFSTPAQIAAFLTSSYGCRAQANGWMGLSLPTGDPRITLGPGWTSTGTLTSIGGGIIAATRVDSVMSFATGAVVDTFTVYYIAAPGNGVSSIGIDGCAAKLVDSGDHPSIAKATIDVPPGPHVLKITSHVLANGILIVGCEACRKSDDHISVLGAGWHGATSSQIACGDHYYSSLLAILNIKPDLITINIGINDWYGRTPLPDFSRNISALVEVATACGDTTVLTPTPTNSSQVPADRQLQYVQEIIRVANAAGVPVIDLHERFGSWETGNAMGVMNDDVHPNARGYADIAVAMIEAIFPEFDASFQRP
jgi:lysophospholipase L1-like esterase